MGVTAAMAPAFMSGTTPMPATAEMTNATMPPCRRDTHALPFRSMTDPRRSTGDGSGIPRAWERRHGTLVAVAATKVPCELDELRHGVLSFQPGGRRSRRLLEPVDEV